jgi:hypothetical protein
MLPVSLCTAVAAGDAAQQPQQQRVLKVTNAVHSSIPGFLEVRPSSCMQQLQRAATARGSSTLLQSALNFIENTGVAFHTRGPAVRCSCHGGQPQ